MKFGHEYQQALANEGFPKEWLETAIDYKHLKKCINKVRDELQDLGLDAETISRLSEPLEQPEQRSEHPPGSSQLDPIPEEFSPQLRVLVDSKTGTPLDATLAPETKRRLQKLAKHELITTSRRAHLGQHATHEVHAPPSHDEQNGHSSTPSSTNNGDAQDTKWISIPLSTARDFFDLLAPKLSELETLREAETKKLEEGILDLGDAVENVIEPVREGYEALRRVSYRDLYFWREMFRLYIDKPVFYSDREQSRGALTFLEAKKNLQEYGAYLQSTGLMDKMKTPAARKAAKQFLELNVAILKAMYFQEMNAQAMRKILKKFSKRTHLEDTTFLRDLQVKYPDLVPTVRTNLSNKTGAGGFANSIAHDLALSLSTKVLSIVPQPGDWDCPVCYSMAWKPVALGCCAARFCIRCVIKMQADGVERCPCCNAAGVVMKADGRNIDFEALEFLEKYFPLETKKRQKENEKADLEMRYGEEFTKPGCSVQ